MSGKKETKVEVIENSDRAILEDELKTAIDFAKIDPKFKSYQVSLSTYTGEDGGLDGYVALLVIDYE